MPAFAGVEFSRNKSVRAATDHFRYLARRIGVGEPFRHDNRQHEG